MHWIDLATVDRSGNLPVHMKGILYGAKAPASSPATGLNACYEVGKSFKREGATEPSFICIRKHICEAECNPKNMTDMHEKSHRIGALSSNDKIRLLLQEGINKIPRQK